MSEYLRKIIKESFNMLESWMEETAMSTDEDVLDEDVLDEERITNKQSAVHVDKRENFVGSHTYGEDLGELGKMYVAYSYGEQHPLYLWYKGKWYYNYDDYVNDDGTINKWTKKHLEDLKPNGKAQGRPTSFLQKLINKFKQVHKIGDNNHTDLEPGEK